MMVRQFPDTLDKLYAKTLETASEIKEAFQNGYEKASQSKPAAA